VGKEPKSRRPPPKPDGAKSSTAGKPDGATQTSTIVDAYSSDFDFLLVNGEMSERMFGLVVKTVPKFHKHKKLVLIVVTFGGYANPTYRTARFLQSVYDEIHAFVPSLCKSAGTLMVTAAHTLIISPFGEIGPLDVQLMPKDEILGRRSGLTTRSALLDLKAHAFELFEHFMVGIIGNSQGAVSFRLASDISARTTSRLMSRIYEQINPDALGQDFRDLSVAAKYGERLNMRYRNLKSDGIKRLVYEYPSHDFVIDLEEAKEVYERAILPTPVLFTIMKARSSDVLIPRTGTRIMVEMLTSAGLSIAAEIGNAKSGTQNAPDPSSIGRPKVRNTNGAQRTTGGSASAR
jgi:hypothetical protein